MSILISGCVEKTQQNDKSVNTSTSTPFFSSAKESKPNCSNACVIKRSVSTSKWLSPCG